MENKPARYAWAGRPFAAAFAAAEERIRKMEYRYVSMLMHCPGVAQRSWIGDERMASVSLAA